MLSPFTGIGNRGGHPANDTPPPPNAYVELCGQLIGEREWRGMGARTAAEAGGSARRMEPSAAERALLSCPSELEVSSTVWQ